MRFRVTLPVIIISVIMLIPCFVLINTLPSIIALIFVVILLVSLYFTDNVRKNNSKQLGIVSIITVIVFALTAIFNYSINPIEGYKRTEWQDKIYSLIIDSINNKNSDISNVSDFKSKLQTNENLSNLGDFVQKGQPVMRVNSSKDELLYLKGTAFADYKDNQWNVLDNSEFQNLPEDFNSFIRTNSQHIKKSTLKIITQQKSNIVYLPYYPSFLPDDTEIMGDICVKNNEKSTNYEITYQSYAELLYSQHDISLTSSPNSEYINFARNTYTQLPQSTKDAVIEALNSLEITSDDEPQEIINKIFSNASYSLTPPKMPDGEDFAVWFLKSEQIGYCMHYATTATVVLRALNIPARYVTGYAIRTGAGEWRTVTSDNAHAWVEYYDDASGWVPLEATPSTYITVAEENSTEETTVNSTTTPTQADITEAQQTTIQPESVAPATSGTSSKDSKNSEFLKLVPLIKILMILAVVISAIFLRMKFILKIRKKRFYSKNSNQSAIHIYRYILRLTKHNIIPDDITYIAKKARFSNKKVTDEEVTILLNYAEEQRDSFYSEKNYLCKTYYKIIVVL
ncbi:MAG: hypothetical protein MJ089_00065 [Ruminococcus sp.]|nr:hypothetical protein [Ruminococcus sp.]